MNIPKAIELLQRDLDDPGSVDIMDLNEAQALSIEALRAWKSSRDFQSVHQIPLLPGEDPE